MDIQNLSLKCAYNWKPVFLRERVEYLFPMDISPYMRSHYRGPAVFRWLVFQNENDPQKTVYIGEAQELCPKRLYGYLNPAPTQAANKKVNADFRAFLKEKKTIRLEVCDIVELSMGSLPVSATSLADKYLRRLLVSALIMEHRHQGFNVVDL